jgi:hypothetical protein
MNKKLALTFASLALVLFVGCTSAPKQSAAVPQPVAATPETGRVAFQSLYLAARGWSKDASAFELESEVNADSKGQDGKSAIWRGSFASPQRKLSKLYVWSGSDATNGGPDRGISPSSESSYNPENTSTQVFEFAFLKTDSDKALEVAQAHGGEKLMKESPDTPVIYLLDWNRVGNNLIWHVIYGPSASQAKLQVIVDATTGNFVRVEK